MQYTNFSINMEEVVNSASKAYFFIWAGFGPNASSLKSIKAFIDNAENMSEFVRNTMREKKTKKKSNYKLGDHTPNYNIGVVSRDVALDQANMFLQNIHGIIDAEFPVFLVNNDGSQIDLSGKEFMAMAKKEDILYHTAINAIVKASAPKEVKKENIDHPDLIPGKMAPVKKTPPKEVKKHAQVKTKPVEIKASTKKPAPKKAAPKKKRGRPAKKK